MSRTKETKSRDLNLDDVVRLQLRKPHKWNWELSTSKSSPHIPLPVIQLYDNKKKLLVETKAHDRKSWHVADYKKDNVNVNIDQFKSSAHVKPTSNLQKRTMNSNADSTKNKSTTPEKQQKKKKILQKSRSDNIARRNITDLDNTRNDQNKEVNLNKIDEIREENSYTDDCNNNCKKYILRACNAGTLLIEKDNYKGMKKRRRKKYVDSTNTESDESDDYNGNRKIFNIPMSTLARKKCDIIRRYSNENAASDLHNENTVIDPKYQTTRANDVDKKEVKRMGANFSRHSSKGLTGRRCQSISNICNSKDHFLETSGREVDGYKFCNSLPSPNGTACNNNHEHKPVSQKKSLPYTEEVQSSEHSQNDCHTLQWKFTETQALCDQGYGSERSPEDEIPPPLPSHERDKILMDICHSSYPFIIPENTFEVELIKGSRGLGLSVCGGIDSDGSWPGLLRIKRLFPHQPAASCGYLQVGDLLLEANGISLTGLSNYEALEVLRMTPNKVILLVCRPPPEVLDTMSPVSEIPPPPPRRASSPPSEHAKIYEDDSETEFEIVLHKIHGSLGFTLCREEEGIVGHYVRALVREPAISDGRIQPGDNIIAVNGEEITNMSHEEAVQFLRQCDTEVHLRLSRDLNKTPVDLSPTDTSPNSSFKPKINLRQEAVDMLSDLAARKLCSESPCSSPRHLHRDPYAASLENQYYESEDDKAIRPCFLDLYNPNQTPVAVRKSKFNLSLAHNAYELNNLDPELLDAPNLNCAVYSERREVHEFPEEPVSMPQISCSKLGNFSHKKPTYQSAHPQVDYYCHTSRHYSDAIDCTDVVDAAASVAADTVDAVQPALDKEDKAERDLLENDAQILNIELNRGWNSRLGFSLQEVDGCTCVSAVYSDSVAARDGRLKVGDCLLKVNDEMVENMKTSDVIDLLRIIRGPVCITVLRRKPRLD